MKYVDIVKDINYLKIDSSENLCEVISDRNFVAQ